MAAGEQALECSTWMSLSSMGWQSQEGQFITLKGWHWSKTVEQADSPLEAGWQLLLPAELAQPLLIIKVVIAIIPSAICGLTRIYILDTLLFKSN